MIIYYNNLPLCESFKYPEYYNIYKGDNFYFDKYLFLLSSKIFPKFTIYPKFIEDELDLE